MDLQLTTEEAAFTSEVLTAYRGDLRMEISQTDNPEYRRGLRHKEELVNTLLAKVNAPAHA